MQPWPVFLCFQFPLILLISCGVRQGFLIRHTHSVPASPSAWIHYAGRNDADNLAAGTCISRASIARIDVHCWARQACWIHLSPPRAKTRLFTTLAEPSRARRCCHRQGNIQWRCWHTRRRQVVKRRASRLCMPEASMNNSGHSSQVLSHELVSSRRSVHHAFPWSIQRCGRLRDSYSTPPLSAGARPALY